MPSARRLPNISFILLLFFVVTPGYAVDTFPVVNLELNGKNYRLEIADTYQRKTQGLMNRRFLPRGQGMIFVYDEPGMLSIWMKNTLIPLTVLWLDEKAMVIDKQALYPCRVRHCPTFGPQRPSQYVVELNQAEFARFQVGDRLSAISDWHSSSIKR